MDAIMTILMYAVICLFVGIVLYYVVKKAVKDAIIEAKSAEKHE
jgi:uncharacterized protein (UPF0333 family)